MRVGVPDFGPERRSSFDRLRMSGYLFPPMVRQAHHERGIGPGAPDAGGALDGEPPVDYAGAESGATGAQMTEGGPGVVT
jgi:hypothetical protein